MIKKLFLTAQLALLIALAQTPMGPRTYLGSHPFKTRTKTINLLAPTTSDSGTVAFQLPLATNVVRVSCATIGSSTNATINLNKRSESTPATPGTDVLSAGLVCDTDSQTSCASGCDVNTISSGAITARQLLFLTISSVTGSPISLIVHVEFTDD
jgi:hypothetical protein